MNEMLLQYLWNYKVFKRFDFADTDGNPLEIIDFGTWNRNAGPDFLNAIIKSNGITFAGHIELHLRSGDWIFHGHTSDKAYQNTILHVVYVDDSDIPDLKDRGIPTLELKPYIEPHVIETYRELAREHRFIPCEEIILPELIPAGFTEQKLLEKLQEKSAAISKSMEQFKNDVEAVLFHQIAYAFGLKINAEIFRQLAESLDFSVFRKVARHPLQAEALLMGRAGFLEIPGDSYQMELKREYDFLKHKYQLGELTIRPKFLRLRPPNFPTTRLAQLAALYSSAPNLYSNVISAKSADEILKIFSTVRASEYWDSHFVFGKESAENYPKYLSEEFNHRLLLNAILPFRYTLLKDREEDVADDISAFYRNIPAEQNAVIGQWKQLGIPVRDAADSQAFLYHYKNFCEPKKCLNCSIGLKILKN